MHCDFMIDIGKPQLVTNEIIEVIPNQSKLGLGIEINAIKHCSSVCQLLLQEQDKRNVTDRNCCYKL